MAAHKLLPYFLFPTTWIVLLTLAALLLLWRDARRGAMAALTTALILLGVFTNPTIANRLWGALEAYYPERPMQELPTAGAIVLLGGGVELAAPPRLEPDLNEAADRLWYAAKLYHAGKAPIIVVTGGQVFPQPGLRTEADYHLDLLLQLGVPRDAIVLETQARNTAENARFTARLLKRLAPDGQLPQHVLLTTSAMHQPRAMMLFEQAGLSPIAATCDVKIVKLQAPLLLDLLPSANALWISEGAIREWLGYFYYRLKARLHS